MQADLDRNEFSLSFRATEMGARDGICSVADRLRNRGISEDRAGDVEIALAEAINNIVEHAYAGIEPGQVLVDCRLARDWLEIRISDMGHPMPDGQLPTGEPLDVDTEMPELPEGGFGWFLIRQLVSDIRYERRSRSNLLSLKFDFPDPSDAPPSPAQPQ